MDNTIMGIDAWQLWLIVAIILFILEIFTSGFLLACFGVGALASCIVAMVTDSIILHVIVFSVATLLSWVFIRPFMLKIGKNKDVPSGMDALKGRIVKVYEDIDPQTNTGSVSCDGDIWKAVSIDGESIKKGEQVEVLSYQSLVLTVKKVNN